jgi:hypothetical protein
MPWVIAGVVGCLVVCVCIAVAGGAILLLPSISAGTLLALNSPTPSSTPTVAPTITPIPSPTRVVVSTAVSTRPPTVLATVAPPGARTASPATTAAAGLFTPTPQCPPSPTPPTGVLFNDDFGSQAVSECNGWSFGPGDNVDHLWTQNKYTFTVKKESYLGFDWPDGEYGDFAVEAEAQPISDGSVEYGIVFRISGTQDARNFYLFFVTSDGEYYVQEKIAGNWVDIDPVKSATTPAIKQGKTKNTFGVIAQGNTFALYINHALVKTFTDDTLPGIGIVGIFAGSDNANASVTFSRFTVLKPEKAQADWR